MGPGLVSRFAIGGLGLVACAVFAPAAQAQQRSGSVVVDLGDCVDLETRERQLECYENRVAEVLETRDSQEDAAGSATTTAPEAASESPRADRRDPGAATTEPSDRPAPAVVREAPTDEADEIVATVTKVQEVEPNAYLIYLDNDQVWRQNRPKRYPLFAGAEVRLSPTHWGPSYRLTDPNVGSFIQVERVR